MKMCDDHWLRIRQALDERGLTPLIGTPEAAMEQAKLEIEGKSVPTDFYDPLMACAYMIYGHAIRIGGLYLMTSDILCPICEACKHMSHFPVNPDEPDGPVLGIAGVESYWINGPTDAALAYCREHGLTPRVQ